MRYPWIDEYLLKKPAVTKDLQPDWNWIRYKLDGKLFAAVCLDRENKPYYITMKLLPEEGELLRGQYEDALPGYYCNHVHWNSVRADGQVPEAVLRTMLDHAWETVLAGLSKKRQREIRAEEAKEEA